MNRLRLPYIFLAVIFLLVGLASGSRIFFVLFFSQIFLLAAALIMNLWAAFSFTFVQEISVQRTLRGRPIRMHLALHNEKPIPYPLMRIRLATPVWQEKRELDFNLAANSMQEFDLQLECPHHGEFDIGMTIIDFSDVFGLLRLPFDMRILPYYRMKQLLVYPRLAVLDSLALPALGSKSFTRLSHATEDQEEPFSMIRDYRMGDPRKLIHWKASLRLQKLQTRQFDQSAVPQILLILDFGQPAVADEAALQAGDVCTECAAALAHYVLRQRWPLQLISLGRERIVHAGHGLKDFQQIYRWLATAPFDGQKPFPDLLVGELAAAQASGQFGAPEGTRAVVVITANQQPQMLEALLQRRFSQTPVYTVFAGPAGGRPGESGLQEQMQQAGLAAWFIHYGDDLADALRWRP
jgi:uncharacterized protein (DUF58 family)